MSYMLLKLSCTIQNIKHTSLVYTTIHFTRMVVADYKHIKLCTCTVLYMCYVMLCFSVADFYGRPF